MEYRVRRRWLVVSIGAIFALGVFIITECCLKIDPESYRSSVAIASRCANSTLEARQNRRGVQKEIWYTNGNQRQQLLVTGSRAEVMLDKKGEKEEVLERIYDMEGIIQEELFSIDGHPMQKVRVIEADLADYSYSREVLTADRVKTAVYQLPGHTLYHPNPTDNPIISGVAKSVEITFSGGELNFKAKKFKAKMVKEAS